MNPISQISPVSDAAAARLVTAETMAALSHDIVAAGVVTTVPGRTTRPDPRPRRLSRRFLIGVPIAAALAVAGLIITSLGAPGQRIGPINVGPPKAQAAVLSFTRHNGFIRVIVRNPLADPRKYRAEFARYHLDISLTLVPASPSVVGSLVYEGQSAGGRQLTPITAIGKCFTGGGGNICPVGVEVPLNFHGSANLVFGRAARPGEQYETSGQADSPGEAMHGLDYRGKTVAAVLAMLARRGFTVPQWRVQREGQCYMEARRSVPADWLVYDAVPWAPGQVLLWAAKTLPVPACTPTPGASPAPSPSPTG
jgi:hypothetical protein